MAGALNKIIEQFKGQFQTTPELLREKLSGVKAFVFDWDGVFNDGMKDEKGSSRFSEVDSMGTNLLRFNHFLRSGELPITAIISGEKNQAAFTLAEREHFDAVYFGIRNKATALAHLCLTHHIDPEEVAFFFDDVLDFAIASGCGLRMMVCRESTPLLSQYAIEHSLADYLTNADGASHAVRECTELLMGISGMYSETISNRVQFSETYQHYLEQRNHLSVAYYSRTESDTITPNFPS